MSDNLLLTIDATAELLAVGKTTVRGLIAAGHLKTVRIGRSVRIASADVEQYVDRLREPVKVARTKVPTPAMARA